jgi:hypothetical protein
MTVVPFSQVAPVALTPGTTPGVATQNADTSCSPPAQVALCAPATR